jgi:hypothetical protein
MPRPFNERQSLEHERAEITRQIAAYHQELENGRPPKSRRERLEWQIRERGKRLAEIERRLAAINKAGRAGGIPLG